jgi:hypothetical protein
LCLRHLLLQHQPLLLQGCMRRLQLLQLRPQLSYFSCTAAAGSCLVLLLLLPRGGSTGPLCPLLL